MADVKEKKRSLETGMLSFARSLQPSEGLFWGTRSSEPAWKQPIEVFEKGVRGQSSEFKTDKPGKSNPQVVEAAVVPPGCDGVRLGFSMLVLPHSLKPCACGDVDVGNAYQQLVGAYADKGGFRHLARLYLWNIANGRFAWRNRFQADAMKVVVAFDEQQIVFDPTRLSLGKASSLDDLRGAALTNEQPPIEELIAYIEKGLSTEQDKRVVLDVTWHATMREGQEIFPSQEYLRDEKREDAASRVYAKLPRVENGREINQASMHSQKIGAALRHIDEVPGHDGAIAVNPYGGMQETGAVLRADTKRGGLDMAKSFYVLRSNADGLFAAIETASDADTIPGDVHFVIANLVRGGVFGQKGGADT
ncbi:MAG: type I-F CRISPR-associated protein Csy3 [Hyphomicrobium sp. 32-62-53]|nr:MAG: type I-F CRISPR-associated protein Csy3 [Hyphomicrobium sp. 12-62-95]OYY00636.1 MAG: type I-F CRISPR-associated protein Csy3 [Hyphomicrobium sp. 32-62-53]